MRTLIRETIIPVPKESIVGRQPELTWQQQEDGSWVGSLGTEPIVSVEQTEDGGGWWVSENLDDGSWAAPGGDEDVFDTAEAAKQWVDAGAPAGGSSMRSK
jgi:hypothetical protein